MIYEQVIKIQKGKMTHKRCEIQKRHVTAMEIFNTCSVKQINQEEFKVESQTQKDVFYVVQRLLKACNCKLDCRSCGACTHMYNCSCMDSAIHSTVCKHVHIVHMIMNSGNSNEKQKTTEDSDLEQTENNTDPEAVTFNTLGYFSELLDQKNESNVKQWIENSLQMLHHQVQSCDNKKILCTIKSHLSAAMAVMDAKEQLDNLQDKTLERVSDPAPNTCHQKQPTFYSTKQKHKTTPRWRKPTISEASNTLMQLNSTEVTV